jgi:hypothetical protein
MAELLRHRQTKGAETDMVSLTPPRHTSTLREAAIHCALGDRNPRKILSATQTLTPIVPLHL